jgi:SAM-dependent methyltransferase
MVPPIQPRPADLGYSLRRHFVDQYQAREIATWAGGSRVLDLGGHKVRKRGQFDIGLYPFQITCANVSVSKQPDVQADATALPFAGGVFDAVVCAEVLEHVYHPRRVLEEVQRVLKAGGRLLITVPFLVQIHGDPEDYGRYTDAFWSRLLEETGFDHVVIQKHGQLWSVVLDALRAWVIDRRRRHGSRRSWVGLVDPLLVWGRRRVIVSEGDAPASDSALSKFTTGFGISGRKRGGPDPRRS